MEEDKVLVWFRIWMGASPGIGFLQSVTSLSNLGDGLNGNDGADGA